MRELFECAHHFQSHGFSPEDFVRAYTNTEEIIVNNEYYNFQSLSWGQACDIILSNSEQYEENLVESFSAYGPNSVGKH